MCVHVCAKVKAQKIILPQSKRRLVRVKAVVFGFIITMEVRNSMTINKFLLEERKKMIKVLNYWRCGKTSFFPIKSKKILWNSYNFRNRSLFPSFEQSVNLVHFCWKSTQKYHCELYSSINFDLNSLPVFNAFLHSRVQFSFFLFCFYSLDWNCVCA